MKKLLIPFLLFTCINVMGQSKQFKVDSIGKKKRQEIELFCTSTKGEKAILIYGIRGMGRAFIFPGDYVTYYYEGKGRRKTKIQRNN
jgi:hypothetical protein